MPALNIKTKGTKQLSRYKIVEWLSKTHPAIILSMYIPMCAYLLYYFHLNINPNFGTLAFVFISGVCMWTLTEYIMHRYLFHMGTHNEKLSKFSYIVHGVHHEYPKDKDRLLMPPIPSIILAGAFFFFWRLITGNFVYSFFSGFMIGYLIYAMIHYGTHALRPPKNRFRYLWVYHSLHHYATPNKAFGVSSPIWDIVFGTFPDKTILEKKLHQNNIKKIDGNS